MASGNSKGINVMIAAADEDTFVIIQDIKSAKVAWEALQTTFEGTNKVKINKL